MSSDPNGNVPYTVADGIILKVMDSYVFVNNQPIGSFFRFEIQLLGSNSSYIPQIEILDMDRLSPETPDTKTYFNFITKITGNNPRFRVFYVEGIRYEVASNIEAYRLPL